MKTNKKAQRIKKVICEFASSCENKTKHYAACWPHEPKFCNDKSITNCSYTGKNFRCISVDQANSFEIESDDVCNTCRDISDCRQVPNWKEKRKTNCKHYLTLLENQENLKLAGRVEKTKFKVGDKVVYKNRKEEQKVFEPFKVVELQPYNQRVFIEARNGTPYSYVDVQEVELYVEPPKFKLNDCVKIRDETALISTRYIVCELSIKQEREQLYNLRTATGLKVGWFKESELEPLYPEPESLCMICSLSSNCSVVRKDNVTKCQNFWIAGTKKNKFKVGDKVQFITGPNGDIYTISDQKISECYLKNEWGENRGWFKEDDLKLYKQYEKPAPKLVMCTDCDQRSNCPSRLLVPQPCVSFIPKKLVRCCDCSAQGTCNVVVFLNKCALHKCDDFREEKRTKQVRCYDCGAWGTCTKQESIDVFKYHNLECWVTKFVKCSDCTKENNCTMKHQTPEICMEFIKKVSKIDVEMSENGKKTHIDMQKSILNKGKACLIRKINDLEEELKDVKECIRKLEAIELKRRGMVKKPTMGNDWEEIGRKWNDRYEEWKRKENWMKELRKYSNW